MSVSQLSLCGSGAAGRYVRTPWTDVISDDRVPDVRIASWDARDVRDPDTCTPDAVPAADALDVAEDGEVRRHIDRVVVGRVPLPPVDPHAHRAITAVVANARSEEPPS